MAGPLLPLAQGLVRLRLDIKQERDNGWDKENADLSVMIKRGFPLGKQTLLNALIPPPSDKKLIYTAGLYYAVKFVTVRHARSMEKLILFRAQCTSRSHM